MTHLRAIARLLRGHAQLFISIAIGLVALALLPGGWTARLRGIAAWDLGSLAYLAMLVRLFLTSPPARMPANAQAQQDAEWTLFFLVLIGVVASFAAILGEFGSLHGTSHVVQARKVAVVGVTLGLSWLLAHSVFALRYAHEYYSRAARAADIDGGLEFPGETRPDYWDFLYFALVLGMTFQVSDVQITARKLRRLATLHGLMGFMFNTVIIALTVNLAAGLL